MTAIKFDQLIGNRIAEQKGKVVVLDIWGTWCPSCKQEFPGLVRLHEKYGAKGVQCMSLCVPLDDGDAKDRPRALAFLEENRAVFTNYWLQDGWEPIQKKLDFEGLPVVVVFGKDGRIAKIFKADDEPRFTYEDVDKLTGNLLDGKVIVAAKATPKKNATSKSTFKNVGPAEFEKLSTAKRTIVLDVRTAKEFAGGHIKGAINIDVSAGDFATRVAKLDKDCTYLVHCASGNRSRTACNRLNKLDFARLFNLEGGIRAWQKAGKPVETSPGFPLDFQPGQSKDGKSGPAAQAAPKPGHAIPARSRQANKDLMDLSKYYTASLDDDWLGKPGANLASLPKGVQAFVRAAFDVRGLIQLAGKGAIEKTGISFPVSVKDIQINRKGRKLYFLHGAVGSAPENAKIGEYLLHYAGGQTKSIPIVYLRSVKDWSIRENEPVATDAEVAWTGENEESRKLGGKIQLFRHVVNNPLPSDEIKTIDFVSTMTESAPFLVAITVEPLRHDYEGFKAVTIDNRIEKRSPKAGPNLVDLSDYYDTSLDDDWFQHPGHDLQDVPRGVQVLGGTPFDVRGLIQLAGSKSLDVTGVVFPEAVKGIKVNRKGQRIHFLQACGWSAPQGFKLGEYVIHYADGQTKSAPILYQENTMDWWTRPQDRPPTAAKEVWRGSNPSTRSMGYATHLIKYTWENPLPNVEITTIDFVSDIISAAPNLVAITVE